MEADILNLEVILPILRAHKVRRAGVFGSYARGEARPESDIDLLVSFSEPKSLIDVIRLENNLSDRLAKKVDIVTERALHRYIKPYVIADLKTIYEEE